MNNSQFEWLKQGRGLHPKLSWSFATDAPLRHFQLARESGDLLAADESGGLHRLDRRGQVVALSRGYQNLRALAWSDSGNVGVAAIGESRLCLFDRTLEVEWITKFPDEILAVAIEPFGNFIAVALANGHNLIYTVRKKRLREFVTVRPLSHLQFLATERTLIGAAEYGLVCCHQLNGTHLWSEKVMSNIGDISATGDGGRIFVAGFTIGVPVFDKHGESVGSYLVEGSPNRLASSYRMYRFAVSTVEGHLYWLDNEGNIVWACEVPEDVAQLQCSAQGNGFVCGFHSGRIIRLDWG